MDGLSGKRVRGEVVVRRPLPEDAQALVDFNRAAAEDYGRQVPEPEEVLGDAEVQRELLEDAAGGGGLLLAAFAGETLVGTVTLFCVGLKKLRHVAELGLAVRPGWKRRGIGRRLLLAALAEAERMGLKKVVARVFADNEPALSLYRSAGFVEEGRQREQYVFRDGTLRDGLLLAKFLEPGG